MYRPHYEILDMAAVCINILNSILYCIEAILFCIAVINPTVQPCNFVRQGILNSLIFSSHLLLAKQISNLNYRDHFGVCLPIYIYCGTCIIYGSHTFLKVTFLARLHFSAEELLLYPRRQRPRRRRRPHTKC